MNEAFAQLKVAFLKELPVINAAIGREIDALPALVRPVAAHVMDAGGKRLRPMLTILFARALGFRGENLHTLASSLEFLHSATLMHDDILDNADLRRGKPAAHTLFGITPTVLAGDVLLALANEIVARTGNPALTSCISQAIMQTATGEIMEIAAIRKADISRGEYIEIITGKTAYLIQSACEFGVIAAEGSGRAREGARTFGLNLGIAFQLVDDALDYTSRADTSGKPLGGDLREGKFTLPLLLYLQSLPEEQRARHHPGTHGREPPACQTGSDRRGYFRAGLRRKDPQRSKILFGTSQPGSRRVTRLSGKEAAWSHDRFRPDTRQISMPIVDRLPPRNLATSLRASLKATFSPATGQLLQEAVKPEPNFGVIASILKLDPALATAILTLVNSPYYGQTSKISDLQRAAIILGDNEILRIALSLSLQKNLNAILEKNGFDTFANWRIIIWAAQGSELIARRLAPGEEDAAYLCALVKDLSLLLYAATFPEHLLPGLKQPDFVNTGPTFMSWQNHLPEDHSALTAELLKQWNFPEHMIAAITAHHDLEHVFDHPPLTQAVILGTRWAEAEFRTDPSPDSMNQLSYLLAKAKVLPPEGMDALRKECATLFAELSRP
jgi:octaprenyl-diphosphate synthase